jgi:glycine/D-amino acid oxidase-like deaminating enzyme
MRILLAYRVPVSVEAAVLADNVVYRPDLEHKGPRELRTALLHVRPHALLTRAVPDLDVVEEWRDALGGEPPFIVECQRSGPLPQAPPRVWRIVDDRLTVLADDGADPSALVHRVVRAPDEQELAGFLALERAYSRRAAARRRNLPAGDGEAAGRRTVVLVGAGVVNLVTALELLRNGYEPLVLERAPDPRSAAHWTAFGCTRGGSHARMFTLTECDNYNPKTPAEGVSQFFRLPIARAGWSVCDTGALTPAEERWIEEYESLPTWLAAVYNDDIFAFNRESRAHWERLLADEPELFDAVELRRGILRLYTDPDHFEWSVTRQLRVGAFEARLRPAEVAERYPALREPCEAGVFAGGVEVVGFTLDVHRFLARLVDRLEREGATFRWETEAEAIVRDRAGRVEGLRTDGEVVSASHYVLSPGAYGDRLLRGLRSEGRIHGVLGVWLTLPNIEPQLTHSLKIARLGHEAEDANVTVGRSPDGEDVLVYGSGYGHTGLDPRNIVPAHLDDLFAAVEENARLFFPQAYEAARESGLLSASQRYCVRPWTASALGIFETAPTAAGGVLVATGGHNTGGFAQSPAVAAAVVAALRGERHPMHELYLPDRAAGFLAVDARVPRPVEPLSVGSGVR